MKISVLLNTEDGTMSVHDHYNPVEVMVFGIEVDNPERLLRIVKTVRMSEMITSFAEFFKKATQDPMEKISFGIPISQKTIDVLLTPLSEIDMSVRAYNCLKAAEISRVYEILVFIDDMEDLKWRNFGKKSRTEILEVLAAGGISYDFMNTFSSKIKPKYQHLMTLPAAEVPEIMDDDIFKSLLNLSGTVFDFSKEEIGSFLHSYSFYNIFSSNFYEKYVPNEYEKQVSDGVRKEIRSLLEKIRIPMRQYFDKEIIGSLA